LLNIRAANARMMPMIRLIPVRVLVIDDDEALGRKLTGWLTEAAYDVVACTDPAVALERARTISCQVALLDLRMPQIDGVALVAALRKCSPLTRIVAMAAFPEVGQVIGAIRAGARDVLEKPIQPAALFAAIERQLADAGIVVRSEEEYHRRLGARVRAARAAADLTLDEVARACGLSPAQLSHIELGKTGTSTWTLARIGSALRTGVAALLQDL
jgi:DNA-binding response OmpR family regulator